jgi:hypothetical protein
MESFDAPTLQAFLDSLGDKSRQMYERCFELYVDSSVEKGRDSSDSSSVAAYLEELHNDGYKTSTLWSMNSMLAAYFEFGLHIILKNAQPIIRRKLELWGKQDSTKKSQVNLL